MRLEDLNWMDVENYLKTNDRLMLVVGACEQHGYLSLLTDVKIPLAISELGISQSDLELAMHELVETTFDDISMRTNPSFPMVPDIVQLYISAFPPRQRP